MEIILNHIYDCVLVFWTLRALYLVPDTHMQWPAGEAGQGCQQPPAQAELLCCDENLMKMMRVSIICWTVGSAGVTFADFSSDKVSKVSCESWMQTATIG